MAAKRKNRGGLKKAQRRFVHEGFSPRVTYKFKSSVARRAKHIAADRPRSRWILAQTVGPKNPRRIKGKSTTLRNMAFVTIRKLPNGVVKITGRKMPSRTNWGLKKAKAVYSHQRGGGTSVGTSLKRAVRQRNAPRRRKR